MDDENFKRQLQQDFLAEAGELVEELEDILAPIRDKNGFCDQVNILFRIIHTLKGSAYTACFEFLGEFVHHVEHLLSAFREGKVEYDEDIIDIHLHAVDMIREILARLNHDVDSSEMPDTADLLDRISGFLPDDNPPPSEKTVPSGVAFGFFEDEDETQETVSEIPETNKIGTSEIALSSHNKPKNPAKFHLKDMKSAKNFRILLCDDDSSIGEYLQDELELIGLKSDYFSDVEDAVQSFFNNEYNLIITDVRMAPVDGVEFIRRIREKDKNIPVIVLSGAGGFTELIAMVELGIQDYIIKPYRSEELEFKVMKSLKTDLLNKMISDITGSFFHTNILIERIFNRIDCGMDYRKDLRDELEGFLERISDYVRDLLKINSL
ncbi:MAG: response regulator [Deltaproteobacteria bacterium]|nr:response regulator [Deltaproteobacteria bacterium]